MDSNIKEMKEKLISLYDNLPTENKNVFKQMYISIDRVKISQLEWAIKQCENTVKLNNKNDPGNEDIDNLSYLI